MNQSVWRYKLVEVNIYTTPTCPWCEKVKEFLTENKVKYKEIDVTEDVKKQQEMIKKSGQMGVPVTIINKGGKETIIVGFDKDKIAKTLGL